MNIETRQKALIEDFNFLDDWNDKYAYLISLGKKLEPFPEKKKNKFHLIKGCQSQVWFEVIFADGKLKFYAASDAIIVSGLIGVLLKVYNGSTAQEILASNTNFMEEIGLSKHLSPTRNNGLYAMINYIYGVARRYAEIT